MPNKTTAPDNLGKLFSAARKKKKIGTKRASERTHIQRSFIEAMEKNELQKLPGHFHVEAYVKAYAEFLGVDVAHALQLANRNQLTFGQDDMPPPEPYADEHNPSMKLALGSLLIFVIIMQWWQGHLADMETDMLLEHEAIMQSMQTLSQKDNVLDVYTNPDPVINVLAVERAIVTLVNDDGQVITSQQLNAGDTLFIPEEEKGLHLRAEPLSAIEIYVDAQRVADYGGLQGEDGAVRLDVYDLLSRVTVR